MGSDPKAKMFLYSFGTCRSKIIPPKTPLEESASKFYQHGSSNPDKFSGFSPYFSAFQRLGLGLGSRPFHNSNHISPSLSPGEDKRFYYMVRYPLEVLVIFDIVLMDIGMIIQCSSIMPDIREAMLRCLVCGNFFDHVVVDRGKIC